MTSTGGGLVIGAHALLAALGIVVGVIWPLTGLGLVALTMVSAVLEFDARRGPIRHLVPRRVAHNLVCWGDGEKDNPTLIVCAPLEEGHESLFGDPRLLALPLVAAALGAVGVGLELWEPATGIPLVLWTSASLVAVGVLAMLAHVLRRHSPAIGRAAQAVLEVQPHLGELQGLRTVLVLADGDRLLGEGLEIFLSNNDHRLDRRRSRVLVLRGGRKGLAFVGQEGALRPTPVDPLLASAASDLGLRTVRATTPATRAVRLGWRAGALLISADTSLDVATNTLLDLLRSLDQAASGTSS